MESTYPRHEVLTRLQITFRAGTNGNANERGPGAFYSGSSRFYRCIVFQTPRKTLPSVELIRSKGDRWKEKEDYGGYGRRKVDDRRNVVNVNKCFFRARLLQEEWRRMNLH